MNRFFRMDLHPPHGHLVSRLILSFLLLGMAWRGLTMRVAQPTFFETKIDLAALVLVPVVLTLLPWAVLYLRRLLISTPSISADRIGLYFDCTFLGRTFIPWIFVDKVEARKSIFSRYLVVRINDKGMDRLGFWRRFLLIMGIGGAGYEIRLPESMYPGTAQELCETLRSFNGSPYFC